MNTDTHHIVNNILKESRRMLCCPRPSSDYSFLTWSLDYSSITVLPCVLPCLITVFSAPWMPARQPSVDRHSCPKRKFGKPLLIEYSMAWILDWTVWSLLSYSLMNIVMKPEKSMKDEMYTTYMKWQLFVKLLPCYIWLPVLIFIIICQWIILL